MPKEVLGCIKDYDIRGIYPTEINEAIFYRIGRAFVAWSKSKKVYVGQDMRVSSSKLFAALTNGIREQGATVIDLGLVSTPMLYMASKQGDAMMVTASHNPARYNGIKVMRKGVKAVGKNTGLRQIKRIVLRNRYPTTKRGKLIRKSILKSYVAQIIKKSIEIDKFKVVIDTGNGMGGLTLPRILDQLPLDTVRLHFKLDGTFPNHTPNPAIRANMKDCQDMVKYKKADLGVAFDGDMDRIMFVDEKARVVPADMILALYAKHELEHNPKAAVVTDLLESRAVRQTILSSNGRHIVSKVGHTYILNKMRREKAILGGEISGHYYWRDFFGAESADLAFIKLLNIMSKTGMPLSSLVEPFMIYEKTDVMSFKTKDPNKILLSVYKEFKDGRRSKKDGVTVEWDDAWFNIRPSHTEAVVRLVIEAKTKERLEQIKKRVLKSL